MKFEQAMSMLTNNGFRWECFRDYFPFGDVALGEGKYERLVTKCLELLPSDKDRTLLLDLLDAQAAVLLEQMWVQNERVVVEGEGLFVGEANYVSAWLQINNNLRGNQRLGRKNIRREMKNLRPSEMLVDRITLNSG